MNTLFPLRATRNFAALVHPVDLNRATRELTAFRDLTDFLTDGGRTTGYFPTCRVDLDARMELLADAYDGFQKKRGDKRRAYRVYAHEMNEPCGCMACTARSTEAA